MNATQTTNLRLLALTTLSASMALTACVADSPEAPEAAADKGGDDLLSGFEGLEAGKADSVKSAKLMDDLGPDSTVVGQFDPRVRVYGYVVEARRGAELSMTLKATAGEDAASAQPGAALDTRMAVYGPFVDLRDAGSLLAESDDDANGLAAPPIGIKVQEDARYLIAFSSWEDTGKGDYQLEVRCEGTDLQCRRPEFVKPCEAGQLYVQGSQLTEDTTWDTCDVVVLEPLTVPEGVTLTVRPGVTVSNNYLTTNTSDMFGDVGVTVHGTLQAVGTPEHPIAFTSFKEDRGWRGLTLHGPSHSIEHAFIERANTAVRIPSGSATVTDTVIEGASFTIGRRNGRPVVQRSRAGIAASADVEATFVRALVKGFERGLDLANAQHFVVEDSIIRDNAIGVHIAGANPVTSCQNTAPPRVSRWRDPVFTHTDIIDNERHGILIYGSDVLVQVQYSNVVGNGSFGIDIQGGGLAPDSFIRNNNIHGNNNGRIQLRSLHSPQGNGVDISSNHWVHISDPELSANWSFVCGGPFSFTNFSPTPVHEAGPREEKLVDSVQKETYHATHQQ